MVQYREATQTGGVKTTEAMSIRVPSSQELESINADKLDLLTSKVTTTLTAGIDVSCCFGGRLTL